MSDCPNCGKAARQHLMHRLRNAAQAHGYELWTREGVARLEVLALPTGPSFGTPQALVDTFKELGQGLPRAPSAAQRLRDFDFKSVRPGRRNNSQTSFEIDGTPPIELVFLSAESKG